ncbi:hypothetical protein MNBD_GAMMA12-3360 [hydrothermal vent metagenome]|uniref:General secretion pathway protein N n=1 Tax=hydrothermal vent metagenome TaxID=652676 RepID=A0A3B0XYG1_9ZZZZ
MIRRISILLGCLLAYLVFLVITFPALHAWGFLKSQLPPIKASQLKGSIWNAQASNLQIGLLQFKKVNAGIKILPLFAGKLAIDTQLKGPGYISTSVLRLMSDTMELSNFKATLPAKSLSHFAYPGVRLRGKLTLHFDQLRFNQRGLQSAQGSSVWTNAVIQGPLKLNLGNIKLLVKTRKNRIHGTFLNTGSADKIKGNINLHTNGRYQLKIYFTPARISAEQRSWLLTISKSGPNGSFIFLNSGNLFKGMNNTRVKR